MHKYFVEHLSKISDIEWSYMAGLIDGEGYIGLTKAVDRRPNRGNSISYKSHVAVTMTHEETVKYLKEKLGGCFYKHNPPNIRWKQQYRWILECNMELTKAVCINLLKYSITKQEQLKKMIEYCNIRLISKRAHRGQKSYGDKEHSIYKDFKKLNVKGSKHAVSSQK